MSLSAPSFPTTLAARPASRGSDPAQRQELADLTLARLRAARDADPVTRQSIVEDVVVSHLWLADSVARRFRDRGEDADNLQQIYSRIINYAIAERPSDMVITTHVCRGNFRSTWISLWWMKPPCSTCC